MKDFTRRLLDKAIDSINQAREFLAAAKAYLGKRNP